MTRAVAILRTTALVALIGAAAGCSETKPPVHWPVGGGRLDLPQAAWRYDGDPVVIRSRGSWAEVLVDGDTELVLDRVGRVYTKHRQPYALLEPDGRLVGMDEELLGIVGSANAALPGKANAWISVTPQGQVIKYDGGEGKDVGVFRGCGATPWSAQACVLVAYLLYYRDEGKDLAAPQPAMMGPGIGTTVVVAP